jgi:uncharacterized surface protein with fasciclin (FAS1) repeats
MSRNHRFIALGLSFALALGVAACGDDGDDSSDSAATSDTPSSMDDDAGATGATSSNSAEICDTSALVAAVESGPKEGTLAGMTDDPVGTAASSNPVLTTLVTAVQSANLVDTLNSAEKLTVFAPTDCAFAALDEATLKTALADPTGLLTKVLGFHVVAGQELSSDDLAKVTELQTFTGEKLSVTSSGETLTLGGQAKVVVPDIETANATVHLIDHVMVPPSK